MSSLNYQELDFNSAHGHENEHFYSFASLETTDLQPVVTIQAILSPEECAEVIKLGRSFGVNPSKTMDGRTKSETRDSENAWIPPGQTTEWLYQKVTDAIAEVNKKNYQFDLSYLENLQFTRYRNNHFYDKHVDDLSKLQYQMLRKLSFSLQLSPPESYEGSDLLVFAEGKDPVPANRQQGSINFFPSFCIHEVTPLTAGTRYTLVGWVRGPKWK